MRLTCVFSAPPCVFYWFMLKKLQSERNITGRKVLVRGVVKYTASTAYGIGISNENHVNFFPCRSLNCSDVLRGVFCLTVFSLYAWNQNVFLSCCRNYLQGTEFECRFHTTALPFIPFAASEFDDEMSTTTENKIVASL